MFKYRCVPKFLGYLAHYFDQNNNICIVKKNSSYMTLNQAL